MARPETVKNRGLEEKEGACRFIPVLASSFDFLKSPDEVNKGIAKRMRQRRKEKKITQVQLAKYSDVSLGSIKRFERIGEISLTSLVKIAFALGCEDDFESLFARKGYASIEEVINEGK